MYPAYAYVHMHELYVPKPKDFWGTCFHRIIAKSHLIRGGGRAGYGFYILMYVVSEATTIINFKIFLRENLQIPCFI